MVVLALIQTNAAVGVVGLAQVVALVIIELSILFSLKINAKEYIIIVFNFYFYTNVYCATSMKLFQIISEYI